MRDIEVVSAIPCVGDRELVGDNIAWIMKGSLIGFDHNGVPLSNKSRGSWTIGINRWVGCSKFVLVINENFVRYFSTNRDVSIYYDRIIYTAGRSSWCITPDDGGAISSIGVSWTIINSS